MVASVIENGPDEIRMTKPIKAAHDALRTFLFSNVYTNPVAKAEEEKAKGLVEKLYGYFIKHPEKCRMNTSRSSGGLICTGRFATIFPA